MEPPGEYPEVAFGVSGLEVLVFADFTRHVTWQPSSGTELAAKPPVPPAMIGAPHPHGDA